MPGNSGLYLRGKKAAPVIVTSSTSHQCHRDFIPLLFWSQRRLCHRILTSPETKSDFDNKASLFSYIDEWCLAPAVSVLLYFVRANNNNFVPNVICVTVGLKTTVLLFKPVLTI